MGESLKRTQVMLEQEQHKALKEIARQEGRSMSDVVREFIGTQLRERKTQQLEKAAQLLLRDYLEDDELTAFTALDAETFHEEG